MSSCKMETHPPGMSSGIAAARQRNNNDAPRPPERGSLSIRTVFGRGQLQANPGGVVLNLNAR